MGVLLNDWQHAVGLIAECGGNECFVPVLSGIRRNCTEQSTASERNECSAVFDDVRPFDGFGTSVPDCVSLC
jgi:hypothetical protein